ncbi:hypothetical protein ACFWWC_42570 [Streptomyces sp. NPDC058642]|uniref:DUF7878 domain-containing protein n=1 Tax=Streptomyces sp. NPDC058642 TaxID=3346572 RepID=UPI00365AB674
MLLLDLEAEFSIWEQGRVVWSEGASPVAELAYQLALWVQGPAVAREDFALESMQAEEGVIRIVNTGGGWRVGSTFTPDLWTSPVTWDVLVEAIRQFVRSVRAGVASMGIEPSFLAEP